MFNRRSLRLPILLAIFMIVLLVGIIVGWILLTATQLQSDAARTVTWVTLLSVGTASLILVLVGTVLYLVLTIKTINLTRRQSNFIDSVTHELKSPIASLKLYLQTLDRRAVTDQQRESFYEYMLEDVERLDHLINHILQAARLERTSTEFSVELVDLTSLIRETAAEVAARHHIPQETIGLSTPPCWVASSHVDLTLVFRNLIDNAVKYSGDPPEVSVQLNPLPAGKVQVIVRDNGPGIPKPLRRKIFTRFVRLGSELQRKKPGTGLGLYIVRTLIGRWKGKIKVRDSDEGTGTVFDVELAAAQFVPPSKFDDVSDDKDDGDRVEVTHSANDQSDLVERS